MFWGIVVTLLGGSLSLSYGELSEEHVHPLSCSFSRTFCGWNPNTSLIAIISRLSVQKSAMSYAQPEGGWSPNTSLIAKTSLSGVQEVTTSYPQSWGDYFAFARSSQRKTDDSIIETVLSSRSLRQAEETQISFSYMVQGTRNTSDGFMRLVTVTSLGQTNILWSLNASQFGLPNTWLPARARLCESSEFHLEFQLSFDGSSLTSDEIIGIGLADVIVNAEYAALKRRQNRGLNCNNGLSVRPSVTCGPTAVNSASLFCGWSIRQISNVSQPRMVPYRSQEDGIEMSGYAYVSVEGPNLESSILRTGVTIVSPAIERETLLTENVFSFWYKCVSCFSTKVEISVSENTMDTKTSLVILEGWAGNLQQTWMPFALGLEGCISSFRTNSLTFAFDVDFGESLGAEFMLDRVWYSAETGTADVTGIVKDWNARTSSGFQITATSRLVGAISTSVNFTSDSYCVPLAINEEYTLVFSAPQYYDVIVYTNTWLVRLYKYKFVLESFAFIPKNLTGNGTVHGVMINAANRSFIWTIDIKLNFRRGINAETEPIFQTVVMMTGSNEIFVDLPTGHYTVEIAAEGFLTTFMTVTAVSGSRSTDFAGFLYRIGTVMTGSDGRPDSTSQNSADDRGTGVIAGTSVSAAIFILIVGGVVWFCYRKKKQQPLGMQKITRPADKRGMPLSDRDRSSNQHSVNIQSLAGEGPLHALMTQYTMLLQIPRSSLEIGFDQVLGRGQFGIVYKGLAHQLPTITRGPTIVAVKTLFKSADCDQQAQFVEEYKVMVKAGRHINIIAILGIVLEEQPMLVIQYCRYGSLLSYLRSRRTNKVYSHVDESGCLLPLDTADMEYQWRTVCEKEERVPESEDMAEHMLSTNDLIKFGHQVSSGMEYLASRSIIHRDLAARNILVTDGKVLKISDFGLARVGGDSYTVSNMLIALPVLWMSPDAILTRTFSEKSDVWSFGVLLWEVFSLGQIPYDGPNVAKLSANGFAEWLMKGHQMTRPDCAPLSIFDIMQLCWRLDKDDRPTFADIWRILDAFVSNMDGGNNYLSLEKGNDKLKELDEQIRDCLAGEGDVMEEG